MDVQEIIVGIIVVCSLGFIMYRILQIIKRISKNEVSSCGCNCANCPASKSCPSEKNGDFIEKKSIKRLQIQKIVVPLQPQSRNNDSK